MRVRFLSVTLLVLAASWLAPLSPVEACAQQTRDKPSRRVTNPARRQPTVPARATTAPAVSAAAQESPDVRLVSAADEQTPAEESAPRRNARRTGRARRGAEDGDAAPEEENLRATVNTLSTQVTRLAGEVNQLKDQQRTLVNLERLTRAEQRAEGLRAQLRDVVEKESALQGRREQLEYELRPENIQRRAAMTGSLNPSALRDEVQRQLEGEQRRVQAQLDLYAASRARLESALVTADAEVERLRARLDDDERRELEARQNSGAPANANPANASRPATRTGEPTNIPL